MVGLTKEILFHEDPTADLLIDSVQRRRVAPSSLGPKMMRKRLTFLETPTPLISESLQDLNERREPHTEGEESLLNNPGVGLSPPHLQEEALASLLTGAGIPAGQEGHLPLDLRLRRLSLNAIRAEVSQMEEVERGREEVQKALVLEFRLTGIHPSERGRGGEASRQSLRRGSLGKSQTALGLAAKLTSFSSWTPRPPLRSSSTPPSTQPPPSSLVSSSVVRWRLALPSWTWPAPMPRYTPSLSFAISHRFSKL